jgi:chromosome partitioning protein
VLSVELGYRIAYQEALACGQGVTSYAPRDAASREIHQLLEELEMFHHGEEAGRGFAAQTAVA